MAAFSSDGASCRSDTAGPESWITSFSAGGSSGATGRSASSDGRAIPSVVFKVVSVVRSSVSNGGNALIVALRAPDSDAVADST